MVNEKEYNELEKILEEQGFKLRSLHNCTGTPRYTGDKPVNIEFDQYTPEGADWYESYYFDGTYNGFVEELKKRIEYFDPEEDASIWFEMRGKQGIPDSVVALIHDSEWKLKKLKELLVALTKKNMRKVMVEYQPYASVTGYIYVPETLDNEETVKEYIQNHHNEIDFDEPELDYAGVDVEVYDEDGDELF